jgi:hypothetical protein
MANELKHASVGSELSQSEWEGISTHIADGQAAGDMLYFDGTYWKRRPYDIGARVYNNANQSIPNSAWQSLSYNSERWDTDNIHDTVTNNSRLTCKTAGKYLVVAQVAFALNNTGARALRIMKNGSSVIAKLNLKAQAIGYDDRWGLSSIVSLEVNDYLTCDAWQNSGGDLNVVYEADFTPDFMMQRIG